MNAPIITALIDSAQESFILIYFCFAMYFFRFYECQALPLKPYLALAGQTLCHV